MRDDIYNCIKASDEDIIEAQDEDIIEASDEDIIEDIEIEEKENEIKEIFPNYKDDESFGGTKKLIKISFEDKILYNRIYNRIYTYYINDEK